MSALVTIRSLRESMSAIERRIADFILDNAHLIRDYSSQQLASALGISQSSVVKFCQRVGFKGYPDLKLSIHEEVARIQSNGVVIEEKPQAKFAATSSALMRKKIAALEETLAINTDADVQKSAHLIDSSNRVYIIGIAEDNLIAREMALQLMMRGQTVISESDPFSMRLALNSIAEHDVLVIVSSSDSHAELLALAHHARERHAKTISITRQTAQKIHALADLALFVAASDREPEIAGALYRFAIQHVFDCIVQLLSEAKPS